MVVDASERRQEREERLRLAIVGANPVEYLPKMFPALAPAQTVTADSITEAEVMDEGGGEWKMAEQVDPREAEELMRMLASGTLTATDLE